MLITALQLVSHRTQQVMVRRPDGNVTHHSNNKGRKIPMLRSSLQEAKTWTRVHTVGLDRVLTTGSCSMFHDFAVRAQGRGYSHRL